MGVAGSGKTTIGTLLAKRLGRRFVDADDFHPIENKTKMAAGVPLTDEDRLPWLEKINRFLISERAGKDELVLACSALKKNYRAILSKNCQAKFFCLCAKAQILQKRLNQRPNHFFPPNLLQSQLKALEISDDLIIIDCSQSPETIVEQIASHSTLL